MKRKTLKNKEAFELHTHFNVGLVFFAALLLCGIAAGGITSSYVTGDSGQALDKYINEYISSSSADVMPKELLLDAAINLCKYPVIIFLLGYTVFGVILIPAVVFLKGFFISFSAASIVRALGYKGLAAALSVYGLQALVIIPCILIISVQAMKLSLVFLASIRRGKDKKIVPVVPKGYFICFVICILILLLCAVLEVFVVPKLVSLAAGLLG